MTEIWIRKARRRDKKTGCTVSAVPGQKFHKIWSTLCRMTVWVIGPDRENLERVRSRHTGMKRPKDNIKPSILATLFVEIQSNPVLLDEYNIIEDKIVNDT
jgi:hypothetical protein